MHLGLVPGNGERLASPPTAVGLVVALFALPVLAALPVEIGAVTGNALKWMLVAVLVGIVLHFEGRPLSSVGVVRPRRADLAWALAIAAGGVGVFVGTQPVVEALGLPTREGIPQPSLPVGLASAVTAGITEEVLFRGYPIERLTDAGYGPLAAGAITWGVFTVAHAPAYPSGTLLQIGLVALGITAAYVRLRSLFPVVVGHVLIDIVGVLAFLFS